MLDEVFLVKLEYAISNALENAPEKHKRSYWCDGILLPDSEDDYSQKKINDTRKIVLRAVIPKDQYKDEQYWFDLILKFGKYSLRRYAKGTNIEDCIPDTDIADWIELDIENKIIEVQLK
ncbi:MAG: hypothetical protein ABJA66_01650 [Actinomycetota bacterium]